MEKSTTGNSGSKYAGEWWQNRNSRRREQYKADKQYRFDVRARNRKSYQENSEADAPRVDLKKRIAQLPKLGTVRPVFLQNGKIEDRLCFTCDELSEVLGCQGAHVIYRWQKNGQLPYPVYNYESEYRSRKFRVYLEEEVAGILECLHYHHVNQRYVYFRKDNMVTIDLIFTKVRTAREVIEGI